MTPEERKRVAKIYVLTFAYYQCSLDDHVLSMYLHDLEGPTVEAITAAFELYRKDRKNRRPPLPADILDLIAPAVTDDDIARDVASTILRTVVREGRYWYERFENINEFWDAIEKIIGSAGVVVVHHLGGWYKTCNFVEEANNHAFSQLRDIAATLMRKAKSGTLDQPPLLPQRPSFLMDDETRGIPLLEALTPIKD